MRFIGDIHGKIHDYQFLLDVPETIQVGDFGIGFAGQYWHDKVNDIHRDTNHRFIRGNHDDPQKCKEIHGFIPDGFVENDVMFIGGAWSIDHAWRTDGVNWWSDEECTNHQLEQFMDIYSTVRPRVMVTHDAPTSVTYDMFVQAGLAFGTTMIKTRTGEAFQKMFEIHQPELWIFGHWHHTKHLDRNGTRFQCLGELDYMDIDLCNTNL